MKFQSLTRAALCAAASCCTVSKSHALDLRIYDPVKHLRMDGFPTNPTVNPTFLNASGASTTRLDLSGIGWNVEDPTKQLTLVSPRHFVGANHFRPPIGSSVRFLGTDNVAHTVTIAAIHPILNDDATVSDVFLGEFATSLPASAAVLAMPYLNLPTEAAYVGEALIVSGQAARGGRGTIGSISDFGGDPLTGGTGITTRAFTFSYAPLGTADDCRAAGGDSGSSTFAVRSGKAALVGTHTAVLTALGTTTTYDTLVPHYIDRLNARMAETGFHMRAIDPAPTAFTAAGPASPPAIPAGRDFVYEITLTNGAAAADNIVATVTSPPGLTVTSVSSEGWQNNGPASLRRGGLPVRGATVIEIGFSGNPSPGENVITLATKSDGSGSQEFQIPVTVLTRFATFASGLSDPSAAGDDDSDGISNLLEYATGGDPAVNSATFPASSERLQPSISTGRTLRFIRRTDAAQRGLSYQIERSEDLSGEWQPESGAVLSVTAGPSAGFEMVDATLPETGAAASFFRLRIALAE